MQPDISTATARNWERLNVDSQNKLVSRANKVLSKKIILPTEYFSCPNNTNRVECTINFILKHNIDIFSAIYTIAVKELTMAKLIHLPHVQETLNSYDIMIAQSLFDFYIPIRERDILGLIYQSLMFEGQKNQMGSYYTPEKVVKNMTACFSFENDETFLDPCCGSGSFLLSINADPQQIYGLDNDKIAVFICKINLLLKFKTINFTPQIYCTDFLDDDLYYSSFIAIKKFDYIATNPPWGAKCKNVKISEIVSRESFSYFFVRSFNMLKPKGIIRFLFPESILNVKTHKDIRSFMLGKGNVESITLYDGMFSGVTTHYVDIEVSNKKDTNLINVYTSNRLFTVDRKNFYLTENMVFNFQNCIDTEIISKVKQLGFYNLKNSIWALGIVTGDNKKKVLDSSDVNNSELIYTGKEIQPYRLKKAIKYIVYERANFQQVAKDEIYRAKEKLVYKFISNKLIFAYDNTQSLFLNSANILIPNIPNMSIKTVLAFLNSEIFQYLYGVLFAEIKILKGNLTELPFPKITKQQDDTISNYVQKVLNGQDHYIDFIQNEIYDIFEITEKQRKHIKEKVYGTTNK